MQEQDYTYPIHANTAMFNESGALKPGACQQILIAAVEAHLQQIGLDVPRLIRQHGVSWILLSMTVEMRAPVRNGMRLTVRTWNTGRSGVLYRRELRVCREDGTPVLVAANLHALFDIRTRRILHEAPPIPALGLPAGETLLQAGSRFICDDSGFEDAGEMEIRPSWIDALGHVNNLHYGDMAYDALPPALRARMDALSRMELYFMHELHAGERLRLQRRILPDAAEVTGLPAEGGAPAFAVRFLF